MTATPSAAVPNAGSPANVWFELSRSLADAAASAKSSVVRIEGGGCRRAVSGVVVGDDLVVTVAHAVERGEVLHIAWTADDGTEHTIEGNVIATDPGTDLALLRASGKL